MGESRVHFGRLSLKQKCPALTVVSECNCREWVLWLRRASERTIIYGAPVEHKVYKSWAKKNENNELKVYKFIK